MVLMVKIDFKTSVITLFSWYVVVILQTQLLFFA